MAKEEGSKGYNIEFIKNELLPEMVHNRCFCESGSREFVEFESAIVESLLITADRSTKPWELYRVNAVVRFSGVPMSFPLIVKLLPSYVQSEHSFARFQNEEMFYSKMLSVYGNELFPKCYASDMGRYGMPVIVLEDLTANEYETLRDNGRRMMNEEELKLSLKSLGRFHGIGLRLKSERFELYREFYMKLTSTIVKNETSERSVMSADDGCSSGNYSLGKEMKKLWDIKIVENANETCTNADDDDISCICHGDFSIRKKVLFKREKNGTPIDVKMIDWQTMRYSSPFIELVIVLIMNIPTPSRDQRFLREILTVYIDAVRSEYTSITRERLIEQLSSTSLDYFNLLLRKDTTNMDTVQQWIEFVRSLRDFFT